MSRTRSWVVFVVAVSSFVLLFPTEQPKNRMDGTTDKKDTQWFLHFRIPFATEHTINIASSLVVCVCRSSQSFVLLFPSRTAKEQNGPPDRTARQTRQDRQTEIPPRPNTLCYRKHLMSRTHSWFAFVAFNVANSLVVCVWFAFVAAVSSFVL